MPSGLKYEPNRKHKWPKGQGSLCQRGVSLAHAQGLLAHAVPDPPEGLPRALYAICGIAAFRALATDKHGARLVWHGFPVEGRHVPSHVIDAWVSRGELSRTDAARLRRQTAIPEACGCPT